MHQSGQENASSSSPLRFVKWTIIFGLVVAAATVGFVIATRAGDRDTSSANLVASENESKKPNPDQPDKPKTSNKKANDSEDAKPKSQKSDTKKKKGGDEVEYPLPQRIDVGAAILDSKAEWLNTSGPITLRDLKGKIVIFDFWTYCCINCMHVLPDLKFLEHKYPNELVVIGVHSAKFDTEKKTENIREAIRRYEIEHPVVNDSEMLIWRRFGIRAWPTLVIIDAEGKACFIASGEGKREILDQIIGMLVKYHKANGTLDETPLKLRLEADSLKPTPLRYPGKVLADEAGNRLFISDSNNNRIVITTLDGKLIDIVGNGSHGTKDGSYKNASFNRPQGMELIGNTLFICDTENNLLRTVDLENKTVATLAGNGKQPKFRTEGGKLLEAELNSPWALCHVDGVLYVAMAGPHQIWSHKLGSETIQLFAGSGAEDIIDGPLGASAFAQPSGLTTDGRFIYVADSEGSSIRQVPVDPAKEVTTIVGTAKLFQGRLFSFGDRDGNFDTAMLQHPLGVVYHDDAIFVADSYNHKIKKIDLKNKKVTTVIGTGKSGKGLKPAQLFEPEGLALAGDRLFIADTNNHRICVHDLKTGITKELSIKGLLPPDPPKKKVVEIAVANKEFKPVAKQIVSSTEFLSIQVAVKLPAGFKLNKLAPVKLKIQADDDQNLIASDLLNVRITGKPDGTTASFTVPLTRKSGNATFRVILSYIYCRDGVGGLCKLKTVRWLMPLEISANAKQTTVKLSE